MSSSVVNHLLASGEELINVLCSRERFAFGQTTKRSSTAKYEELCKHKAFAFTQRQTKVVLPSVCLYLSVTEDHKPLTISRICSTVNCSLNEFGKVYNQVLKEFPNLKNDMLSVEELAENELKVLKVDESERQTLVQRTIELIRIFRKCCLIEGLYQRSQENLIYDFDSPFQVVLRCTLFLRPHISPGSR